MDDLNPKNENWNNYKLSVANVISNKADKLYQDLEYADEHKVKYILCLLLRSASNMISSATFTIALYLGFCLLFSWWVSFGISVVAAFCYEWLKNDTWKTTSKDMLKYGKVHHYAISALIVLHLGSIGGSAFGAWQTANLLPDDVLGTPNLIDIDSVNSSYLSQINKIDAIILEQSNNAKETTSNHTKVQINKTLVSLSTQKDLLIKQQNKTIEKAEEKNALMLLDHNSSIEELEAYAISRKDNIQLTLLVVSIVSELILLLCSMFISFYLFRKWVDDNPDEWIRLKQIREENKTTQTTKQNKVLGINKTSAETKTKQSRTPKKQAVAEESEKRRIGFGDNKTKQKFVWNNKEYKKYEIESMINTYNTRAEEAKQKGKEDVKERNQNKAKQLQKLIK